MEVEATITLDLEEEDPKPEPDAATANAKATLTPEQAETSPKPTESTAGNKRSEEIKKEDSEERHAPSIKKHLTPNFLVRAAIKDLYFVQLLKSSLISFFSS